MDLPGHSEWDTEGHRGELQHLLLLPALQSGYLPVAAAEPRRLRVQPHQGQTVAQGKNTDKLGSHIQMLLTPVNSVRIPMQGKGEHTD